MVNKKTILLTSIIALALSFSASASKPIYKWKDGQGNIKYTQSKPPRGTEFEIIYQRASDNSQSERVNNQNSSQADLQDDIIAKQSEEIEKAKKANEEIANKNCTIAKNNLETLETSHRVFTVVDGKRRLLTDKERTDKLATAKSNVSKYCK
ncbi:hypothetical protein GCM10009123_00030 [Kangiella japonica]|uniref:DUF4124 domain-containing protein n=1 Tax=Kangiella japonica TaxID=647384 RepID=A0ABP3CCB1_9GAMM